MGWNHSVSEQLRFAPPTESPLSTAASSHLLPPSTIHPPHLNCYLPQPASPARLPLAAWQKLHKYTNNNYYFTSLIMHTASQPATTTLCKTDQQHPCGGGWHLLRLLPPLRPKNLAPKRKRKETRVLLGCIGRPPSRGKAGTQSHSNLSTLEYSS